MTTELPDERPILLAEDDIGLRDTIEKILKTRNYGVIPVGDGEEAWEAIRKRVQVYREPAIKLIVSDWKMPNLAGIDLLKRIRESGFPDIPFLLISGMVSRQELQNAIALDTDGVLLKPFDGGTLLKEVDSAISIRDKKVFKRGFQLS